MMVFTPTPNIFGIAAEKAEAVTKTKKAVVKKARTRLKSNKVHSNA